MGTEGCMPGPKRPQLKPHDHHFRSKNSVGLSASTGGLQSGTGQPLVVAAWTWAWWGRPVTEWAKRGPWLGATIGVAIETTLSTMTGLVEVARANPETRTITNTQVFRLRVIRFSTLRPGQSGANPAQTRGAL